MNKHHCHILSPLLVMSLTMSLTFSSCGSKRRAINTPQVPRDATEITLDDLIGSKGGYVATPAPMPGDARQIIETAHRWLGTPYRYGGDTRSGVDCSALVMNVYKEALGLKLPRTTATQSQYAQVINRKQLTAGDLVFFSSTKNSKGISHVGIYIGKDRFIHASSSRGVVISRLSDKYFEDHYHSAGRVLKSNKHVTDEPEEILITQEAIPINNMMELNLDLLDHMITATIDSIYAIPVDNDPNIAPGL